MLSPTDWHPVVAAQALRAGENIVAARVLGHDMAVWRSDTGNAQVWHDRCPHRGVRLSLGRIIGGRLSCAYHGWEFAADSGRCVTIPALVDLSHVPGQVCARSYPVAESQSMIWVRLEPEPQMAPAPARPAPAAAPGIFVRCLAIRATGKRVDAALLQHGCTPAGPGIWQAVMAQHALRMFILCVQADLTFVHVWLCEPLCAAVHKEVFAALRRLRGDAEADDNRGQG